MSSFHQKLFVSISAVAISIATASFEAWAGDDDNRSDRRDHSESQGESKDHRDNDDDDDKNDNGGGHSEHSGAPKSSGGKTESGSTSILGASSIYRPETNIQSPNLSQNDAQDAVQHGKARKLKEVIRAVKSTAPGNIISVNLRSRGDSLIYDIKVLTKQQTVKTISINANTLSIY